MWLLYKGHRIWVTGTKPVGKWWMNRKGMWIIYNGRWVWTTGIYRRWAGRWIFYKGHKVWVLVGIRKPAGRWWVSRKGYVDYIQWTQGMDDRCV